jgi:excinuclease ABC subunit A
MSIFGFYQQQSIVSDPGDFEYLFEELPRNLRDLCTIVQGLVFHYAEEQLYHYQIPEHRFSECHLCTIENILARLHALKAGSLLHKREFHERVVGVCRENALLLCSMLRYHAIPARVRVGFANYILPDFYVDGMCVEYWNNKNKKWCYVDARTTHDHIQKLNLKIDFDLLELPSNKYIGAAQAWQLCRRSEIPANRFGYGKYRGLWAIRNRLLQDLATVNRDEVLLWDRWGLMSGYQGNYTKISEDQLYQLDEMANAIIDFETSNHLDNVIALACEYL